MATFAGAENIRVLRDSHSVTSDTLAEPAPRVPYYTGRRRRKWQFRSIGSSGILLILTWQFITSCSLGFTFEKMNGDYGEPNDTYLRLWQAGICVTLCFIFPIVSIIGEVVIGRYKLVSYCLKTMWCMYILALVLSLCEENLPVRKTTIHIIQVLIAVLQFSILGAFLASAVPLGIDQVTGGSDANISAFIHWLNWGFYSGFAITSILGSVLYNCTHIQPSEVSMVMSLLPVLLLSVGLILDFHFHHKLVKEPVTVNPVSHILKVLKYAAKHKYPVQRSAFTYCENERPTRLDYGKSKYGGPFTTEQVEDVKTFWRVLVVIVVISMCSVSLIPQSESSFAMDERFCTLQSETNCIQGVAQSIIKPASVTILFIPLYELLIYPCLRNRGPSILQSAGIGAAALIVSSLYGVTAGTIPEILSNGSTQCMLTNNSNNSREMEIIIGIPFNFLLGFTSVVLPKSGIEFVCAQAPYNMKGFLIGLFFTALTSFIVIGTLLYFTWNNTWFPILHTSTCGIWFYLSTLVLAVVSSALLGLVIRWYKARERDEITRSQDLVEEVYHKYHEQESQDESG